MDMEDRGRGLGLVMAAAEIQRARPDDDHQYDQGDPAYRVWFLQGLFPGGHVGHGAFSLCPALSVS